MRQRRPDTAATDSRDTAGASVIAVAQDCAAIAAANAAQAIAVSRYTFLIARVVDRRSTHAASRPTTPSASTSPASIVIARGRNTPHPSRRHGRRSLFEV